MESTLPQDGQLVHHCVASGLASSSIHEFDESKSNRATQFIVNVVGVDNDIDIDDPMKVQPSSNHLHSPQHTLLHLSMVLPQKPKHMPSSFDHNVSVA
jgi:hypothetical protein